MPHRYDWPHDLLRFQDYLGRVLGQGGNDPLEEDQLISGSWTPPCDIVETGDSVVLRAELPGVQKEDVEIQLESGVLTVRGQRRLKKESSELTYHRIERSYGNFVRTFSVPRNIDPERIRARMENGILEVEMAKKDEAKPRHIRIDS